jgi:protein-disulfide isomerase
MARVNPGHVIADMVDAQSFPSLSDKYSVSSVPVTIVNGNSQQVGAVPEAQLASVIRREIRG